MKFTPVSGPPCLANPQVTNLPSRVRLKKEKCTRSNLALAAHGLTNEGLPNRVGPKPEEIGSDCYGGTPGYAG